ncbi:MAG: class I SAM-dependent methyltransferase [candidate division WOR-3 bacterium]
MNRFRVFEENLERYEEWFEKHRFIYFSELEAVKSFIKGGKGLEVGVGTGRFAGPLGIQFGIDPAFRMLKIAKKKGIQVIRGVSEFLPFKDGIFDFVLFVTTICFVDDIKKSLQEAHRVLRDGGDIIVGFVDRESPLGKIYWKKRNESVFYKHARFYSVHEFVCYLRDAGFVDVAIRQTLFGDSLNKESRDPVIEGYGQGSFVVVRGKKK